MDHESPDIEIVRNLLQDFYLTFYPTKSSFELSPEYRNRVVFYQKSQPFVDLDQSEINHFDQRKWFKIQQKDLSIFPSLEHGKRIKLFYTMPHVWFFYF